MVRPIPEGFQTLTPHIICRDAAKAMDWYIKAFGAVDLGRHAGPDGKLMHGLMKIGSSMLMLADEFPEMKCLGPKSIGGTAVTMHVYVEDADAVYNRAIAAGGKATMPIADQFWGDRYGVLEDPFGHAWSVATHKYDYTPEQMAAKMQEAMAAGDCAPA
jgi:uncharacterized glyoxalase superfamily protein PhnB